MTSCHPATWVMWKVLRSAPKFPLGPSQHPTARLQGFCMGSQSPPPLSHPIEPCLFWKLLPLTLPRTLALCTNCNLLGQDTGPSAVRSLCSLEFIQVSFRKYLTNKHSKDSLRVFGAFDLDNLSHTQPQANLKHVDGCALHPFAWCCFGGGKDAVLNTKATNKGVSR
ncbi:unnamed protein product [Ostreobium quekettii]|uniref:Uncharacterized protein n=1 Tax=Ostreobium quekettii TaxID=121088 RepID=A0A8S1IWU3_9CHLO|nr:unnamed protein product [Ostreobium quekettii]